MGKKVEHAVVDNAKDIYTKEGVVRVGENTRDDLILADIAWRLGKFMQTPAFKESADKEASAVQFVDAIAEIDEEDLNYVINAAEPAFKDASCVLATDPSNGSIKWMPKTAAEEAGMPYVHSVKQAIGAYAKAMDTSYDDMADYLGEDYSGYYKAYNHPEGNAVTAIGESMVAPRNYELDNDPQLASKDWARTKAVLGDTGEFVAASAVPAAAGFAKGKRAYDAARPLMETAKNVGRGAAVGGAASTAGYATGLAYDKAMPNTVRENREFDPLEALMATAGGAAMGAGAGYTMPRSADDAGRHILYNDTKDKSIYGTTGNYKNANLIPDDLLTAAKRQQVARGENGWVYEPMNNAAFDEFQFGADFLPKRTRGSIREDNIKAPLGTKFELKDNPLGGKAAPNGSSGIEVSNNDAAIEAQRKAKEAAKKRLLALGDKEADLTGTQRPMVQQYDYNAQLAEIDNQLRYAVENADEKAYNRLMMKKAALEDKMKQAQSNVSAKNDAVRASNIKTNNNISHVNQQKAEAQRVIDEPDIAPEESYELVMPDYQLASTWGGKVDSKYPKVGVTTSNAKKFLVNSQGPNELEYAMTHGGFTIPKKELNRKRGLYSTDKDDESYNHFMYKLLGEAEPVGMDKDAWKAVRAETSKREKMVGDNPKGNVVGGDDFAERVAKERGKYAGAKTAAAGTAYAANGLPYLVARGDVPMNEWFNDYETDFIPTKKK